MDLYEQLGVSNTAPLKEIKKAYRSKAQKCHPDKKGGDAEMFHDIVVAYETLKDREKREKYDETGEYQGQPVDDIADRIVSIFSELVASGKYDGDLVKRGLDMLDKESQVLDLAKVDIESEIVTVEKLLGRLASDGDEPNLFEKAVNDRSAALKVQVGLISQKDEQLKEMRNLILKYTDTKPQENVDWTGGYIVPEHAFTRGMADRRSFK